MAKEVCLCASSSKNIGPRPRKPYTVNPKSISSPAWLKLHFLHFTFC